MHPWTLLKRICPYRFHPTARWMRRLCIAFALTLTVFAVMAEQTATTFPDYLLVCRYIQAAWDAVPTLLAVGVIGGVWLDLAIRQYADRS